MKMLTPTFQLLGSSGPSFLPGQTVDGSTQRLKCVGPMGETWISFLAPSFSPAQPWLSWACGE